MLPDPAWTRGRPNTAPREGLHQTFARTARRRPDAVALRDGDRSLTYRELDRAADAWAARLAAEGAGPGRIVPILLPRGFALVTALIAVLKTGAAYALLDPAWPGDRLAQVVELLAPPVLVSAAHGPAPAGTAGRVPRVWTPPATPLTAPPGFRATAVDPDVPCCVFFTSGTTGRPKGVVTAHRATARLFPADGFARFDAGTAVPLAAPAPWDAFSLELWSVLLTGGTSLLVDDAYLSPAALRAATAAGADTTWLTSTLFNLVVDEDIDAFRGLRQVMIGGERLSASHVRRFLRHHPGTVLLNGYGPVESTVFATTHRVREHDCELPGGIPLGRPVPGTSVHVLDGDRPCAVGETGEICVGGDGLALRYLGDPGLTARAFATVSVDGRPRRLYRTGDLGVWGPDGLLHFRGRADRQLKIRGHRVEPAEVERQIERLLPGVRTCRVLGRPAADGGLELVGFYVPRLPGDPLPGAEHVLRAGLVAYQRPSVLVGVDALPRTPQGKLDERRLLALAPAARPARDGAGPAAPADPVGRAVADAFASVLGCDAVPPTTPFVELGGTSLGAGRVCARLATALGRPVPVSWLYEQQTVQALAARLRENPAYRETTREEQPSSARGAGTALTPLQTVYLTRQLRDPADLTAHCLLTWEISGELDLAALRTAVARVHRRHEPLRAAYRLDPRPHAVAVDVPEPLVEVLAEQADTAAAVRSLRAELADELAVEEGEVWRVAWVPVTGDRPGTPAAAVLGCVVHHVAFDGWSESVLARDLASAYAEALRPTGSAAPPAPTLAEVHAARLLRDRLAGPADRHDAFLRDELKALPELAWPAPAAAPPGTPPGRVEATVSAERLARVDALAAEAGTTRFCVLLAHWAASVADTTGARDFGVGVPVAQRDSPLLERAVGCHIEMVCLRMRDAAVEGGTAGVLAAARTVAGALAAQDVPFVRVLGLVDPPVTGRPPLYQVLFALQDNDVPRLALPGVRAVFLRQPYLDLPLELHTELWPDDEGGLRLEVAFRPDAVAPDTARQIADRFLDRLSTDPYGETTCHSAD